MKSHRSALTFVFLVSLALAKGIPAADPISNEAEKKTIVEEKSTKIETTDAPAAIAIEDTEEPKQADRAKKSATTTFCVEIKPGPSDAPVKVCDEHHPPPCPPPQYEPPSDSPFPFLPYNLDQNLRPVIVVPPKPLAVFFPDEPNPNSKPFIPFPHKFNHHQPQAPIPVPPPPFIFPPQTSNSCPPCPASCNGLHPHASISLYRSAMAPIENIMLDSPMNPEMQMRSGNPDDLMSTMNSGSMLMNGMEVSNQMSGSEALETPFGRTHIKKLYNLPLSSYYNPGAGGSQYNLPYVVQCNPEVLSLGGRSIGDSLLSLPSGKLRDASVGSFMTNTLENGADNTLQLMSMGEPQMTFGMPQGGRTHIIHPSVHSMVHTGPSAGLNRNPTLLQHTTTYQTYASPYDPLHSHPMHPSYSGYSAHPHSTVETPAINHFYRREGLPAHKHMAWNYQPAANMQRTSSGDMAMQQMQQPQQQRQQQQQLQEKPYNQQTTNMERTSSNGMNVQQQRSQPSAAMSPSQMINEMKGAGGVGTGVGPSSGLPSIQRANPMMKSFPREQERMPCKEGVQVSMHIPPGGQPFMITGPRNSMDKKSTEMHHGGSRHEEMGKREVEKSTISEKGA